MPRETNPRNLRRRFLVSFAQAELGRLGRDERRFDRAHGKVFRRVAEFLLDLRGVHVPDDDEDNVVRDVMFFVVRDHVIAGDAVVDVRVSDDGEPVGMRGVGGGPEHEVLAPGRGHRCSWPFPEG